MSVKSIGSLIGGLGVGAAAMYLFDPKKGRARRARLRDKSSAIVSAQRKAGATIMRDAQNRLKGATHKAGTPLRPRERVSDYRLAQRVRSAIGHAIAHNSGVNVEASNGRIMLSGPVLRDEEDTLVKAVWAVQGVCAVENQLDVHDASDGIASLQGDGKIKSGREHSIAVPPAAMGMAALGGILALYGFVRRDRIGSMLTTVGMGMINKGLKDKNGAAEMAPEDSGWR